MNVEDLRLDKGEITATAGNDGNGGNININATTVLAKKNSEITANAFRGNGGNIEIDTVGFFLFPDSVVTASSELGIDGTVRINSLDRNLQKDLELGEVALGDPNKILENTCLGRSRQPQATLTTDIYNSKRALPNFKFFTSGPLTGTDRPSFPDGIESIPESSPESSTESRSIPNFVPPSQSMIPGRKIVKTEDGRVFLVAAARDADSIICRE